MKRPKSVWIGPVRFSVEWSRRTLKVNGQEAFGHISPDLRKIMVQSGKWDAMTLLHEIIHGLSYVLGYRVSECRVEQVENAVASFVIDNPGVVDWIKTRLTTD